MDTSSGYLVAHREEAVRCLNCGTAVSFLDANLDLGTGKHNIFMKFRNNQMYLNKHSNHPQIPEAMNKRIRTLSRSKVVFKEAASIYEKSEKKRVGTAQK